MENKINTITCDSCVFQKYYTPQVDEVATGSTMVYCSKGHWDMSPQYDEDLTLEENEYDAWVDCKDFKINANGME